MPAALLALIALGISVSLPLKQRRPAVSARADTSGRYAASVAVLPFQDLSGDTNEYFSEGITAGHDL